MFNIKGNTYIHTYIYISPRDESEKGFLSNKRSLIPSAKAWRIPKGLAYSGQYVVVFLWIFPFLTKQLLLEKEWIAWICVVSIIISKINIPIMMSMLPSIFIISANFILLTTWGRICKLIKPGGRIFLLQGKMLRFPIRKIFNSPVGASTLT